jgi:phosphoenolpyruvate carboxykinase (ATP)
MDGYNVNAYLVNTGWVGGGYGVGSRMSIKATRACINAILDGSINDVDFDETPWFRLKIPKTLPGVETNLLNPRNAWEDKESFDNIANKLAGMFIENFKKYTTDNDDFDFTQAGPKV